MFGEELLGREVCVQLASRRRLGYFGATWRLLETCQVRRRFVSEGRSGTLAEKMGWLQCLPHFYSWVNKLSESKPASSSYLASV